MLADGITSRVPTISCGDGSRGPAAQPATETFATCNFYILAGCGAEGAMCTRSHPVRDPPTCLLHSENLRGDLGREGGERLAYSDAERRVEHEVTVR